MKLGGICVAVTYGKVGGKELGRVGMYGQETLALWTNFSQNFPKI